MRKIYLLGDSIRYGGGNNSPGYGPIVKQKLEGLAEVYYPNDNCRFTQYTLRYIDHWANGAVNHDIDTVHWNNGLWDECHYFDGEPLTPIDYYAYNIGRIYKKLRIFYPDAKIIFAASTPIIEAGYTGGVKRFNSEIRQYNEKAKEVVCALGGGYNDLYSVAEAFGDKYRADSTHFDATGCEILADAVIRACGFDFKK